MQLRLVTIFLILSATTVSTSSIFGERGQKSFESGLEDLIKRYPRFKKDFENLRNLKSKIPQCDVSLFRKGVPNLDVEEHKIETDDGYIITTFRVKPKNDKTDPNTKPTVLLMHGVASDGHTFFTNGPGLGIGHLLVEHGFDVWAANNRGSKFSRYHKTLDIHKKEYWQFSFMEFAEHDLPANFDYIRKVSHHPHLILPRSQETTRSLTSLTAKEPPRCSPPSRTLRSGQGSPLTSRSSMPLPLLCSW